MLDKKSKIYVSGHTGMVGNAVVKLLRNKGYTTLIFKTSKELDLRKQTDVEDFFKKEKPAYVFHFAAKVGGIKANISYPAEFLYDNILIETNVIHASYKNNVKKLLYLGSSCIYPRECPQPMKEEYLLTGRLEPTNEGYALAKIVGLKLCEFYNQQFHTNFISLMPPNLYGENDNFDPNNSHVIAALIKKFVDAKIKKNPHVKIWGTGNAKREFLCVEDLAQACLFFMDTYNAKDIPPFINVGYGEDVSIKEIVEIIKDETDYQGDIEWDVFMPDGMPRKFLDSSVARELGWCAKISLEEGIKKTIQWYIDGIVSKS